MKLHPQFQQWLCLYNKYYNRTKSTDIDDKLFRLIVYVVSSNASLKELKRDSFINILDPSIKCPSYHVFRNEIIPAIMKKFYNAIQVKLNLALSISLIVDIWTNRSNRDYLALSASMVNQ
jgi:hypothetical protein